MKRAVKSSVKAKFSSELRQRLIQNEDGLHLDLSDINDEVIAADDVAYLQIASNAAGLVIKDLQGSVGCRPE